MKRFSLPRQIPGILLGLLIILANVAGTAAAPLTATTPAEAVAPCVPGASCRQVYLPFIGKPSSPAELKITGLEVTQAVQNASNSVLLVAGKHTVVRVYGVVAGREAAPSVQLALAGTRDGAPLPGSPLIAGAQTLYPGSSRADTNSSFNVPLPDSWTAGSVTLVATLNPDRRSAEANPDDNAAALPVTFRPAPPPLSIKLVPVNYTHAPTGKLFPGPDEDTFSEYLAGLYPISALDVSVRPAVGFAGDLTTADDWTRLLQYITDIKRADGAAASQIYLGLVARQSAAGEEYRPAASGYGWYGHRTAVALMQGAESLDGPIAAHEIGHNLGRYHAPCGNPPNPDTKYPYPSGSIGQFGFDVRSQQAYAPEQYRDFMGYCFSQWVSDYTYQALYDDQMLHGIDAEAAAALEPVLLVRAAWKADGQVRLLPAYALQGVRAALPAASQYRVEMLDAGEHVLASYPVEVLQGESGQPGDRSISATLPLPAGVARLRLVGPDGSKVERSAAESSSDRQILPRITRENGQAVLRWGDLNTPALLRYIRDGSQEVITVGLDLTGGVLRLDSNVLPVEAGHFEISYADVWEVPFAR